jgi:hypothetical protein
MEIVFLLVGLPFILLGAFLLLAQNKASHSWTKTPGEIVGYINQDLIHSRGSKPTLYPVARFFKNGVAYLFKCPVGSPQAQYPIGQKINVFYDEREPPHAAPEIATLKVMAWILIGFGSVAVTVFLATFKFNMISIGIALFILGQFAFSAIKKGANKEVFHKFINKDLITNFFGEASLESDGKFQFVDTPLVSVTVANNYKVSKAAAAVFLAMSLAGSYGSYSWHLKRETFLSTAATTTGKVVRFEDSSDSDGTVYYPVITYRHPASGEIQFKHNVGSSHPSYNVGDDVKVYYSKNNPHEALLDSGIWNHLFPLLALAISLLASLASLYILLKSNKVHKVTLE